MPESLPSLEETIGIYKLKANKSLGQHFLLDTNTTDKIARLALPLNQCETIEVGPGPGGLTRSLLKNNASLTVIEMDDRINGHYVEEDEVIRNISIKNYIKNINKDQKNIHGEIVSLFGARFIDENSSFFNLN